MRFDFDLGIGMGEVVFFAIVGFLLVVLLLQWLWNTTVPEVFSLKSLSYGQTFKLLLIFMILSGGGSTLVSYSKTKDVETTAQANAVIPDNVVTSTSETLKIGTP